MSGEDRFDALIRRQAPRYRVPPETPRDAMWERIQAERRARRVVSIASWNRRRWSLVAAAAAAVLLIGVAIGRFTSGRPEPAERAARTAELADSTGVTPPTGDPSSTGVPATYRLAAAEHFGRAEVLLTQFRRTQDASELDAGLGDWARELLTDTRLLLGSPAATNLETRQLLEDLEILLAQITHAASERRPEDRRWVADGMARRGVLDRLRLFGPSKGQEDANL